MRRTLRVLSIIVIVIIGLVTFSGLYVKIALPHISAEKDLKIETTPARIARGEYLSRSVAGCLYCHSAKNEELLANPIKEDSLGSGGELSAGKKDFQA